jgi:hypothetical protein
MTWRRIDATRDHTIQLPASDQSWQGRFRARSRQHRRPQTRPTPHGVQWYSADMPFGGTKQSGVGRQLTVIGMVTYYVG